MNGERSFALRGRIFTPLDPGSNEQPWAWWTDGVIAVENGRISFVGEAQDAPTGLSTENISPQSLLVPGFVDTHLHGPQLEMIGSYGGDLLKWLETYTFPTECRFADPEHARRVARLLFPLLIAHGTTTAMIFSSVHEEATHAFFEMAEDAGMRAIIGKILMDRNAPEALLESVSEAIAATERLIDRWHGAADGLLGYAITPRFAPTSTAELLEAAGSLARSHPDVWVQTHISENRTELDLVRELFPDCPEYARLYDRHGLLGKRTVLAHGIHLSSDEIDLIKIRGSSISHCPNSNLFLGSGLFPLDKIRDAGISTGLGSDIGAGTSPSMLSAMADTYKVQQIRRVSLSPFELWHLSTLGGACALGLEQVTGSLEVGKEADLLLLDPAANPLIAARGHNAASIEDLLAALIFLGDDRLVNRVWIRGREVQQTSISQ